MTLHVVFKVAKVDSEAKLPTRKHEGDAGIDFYCLYDTIIQPFGYKVVQTGITVELSPDYHGILKPKGKNNHLVGAGVIENSYQGEILFKLFNPTEERRVFKKGTAIGQMILIPAFSPMPVEFELEQLHESKTIREGTGGIVEQRRVNV